MMNLVQANRGTVWFLNDPIEDNLNHSWDDYKTNWESTLTASLLCPQVWRYEVMPWPERIFRGRYPSVDRALRKRGERVERVPIPPAYGTELMTVINTLNDMDQKEIAWDCGTRGIGVVVSDTMMFQRGQPNPSDKNLGSFYGLALPLLKHGIPAEPVQLENATTAGALARQKVLLMTYEGMKPMTPDVHDALANWVRQGGALVFLGDDTDPFNAVRAWWNDPKAAKTYKAPRAHLFERLGLLADVDAGLHKVGKGSVVYDRAGPASLTYRADGAEYLLALVKRVCVELWLGLRRDEPPDAPKLARALRRRRWPRRVDRRPGRRPQRSVPRPLRRCPADGRRRDPEAPAAVACSSTLDIQDPRPRPARPRLRLQAGPRARRHSNWMGHVLVPRRRSRWHRSRRLPTPERASPKSVKGSTAKLLSVRRPEHGSLRPRRLRAQVGSLTKVRDVE